LTILDLALRLARESDLAVLGVFHDLNLAAAYCDELSLMRDGRILAHGTPETALSADWIATVYGLDVTVVPHPQSGRPVVLSPAAGPRSLNDDGFPPSSLRQADPSLVR
jgi:iron complex transport system ATP-binding protein